MDSINLDSLLKPQMKEILLVEENNASNRGNKLETKIIKDYIYIIYFEKQNSFHTGQEN